jgi:hypothetical protein
MQVVDRISRLADGGFNTYVTDAQRGYTVILVAGPLAALVLCLVYMVLLRFFAGVVAWAVVILINLLCAAMTLIAAYKGELLVKLPALSQLNEFMAKTGSTMDGVCFPSAGKHWNSDERCNICRIHLDTKQAGRVFVGFLPSVFICSCTC